jgi:predicted TIM-barrel fold metal-dependent hydrolase
MARIECGDRPSGRSGLGRRLAPGFSATMKPRIERLDARCAELGWQLDFLAPGWLTEELLPIFARLRCSFTIAHMGMFRAEAGAGQGLVRAGDGVRHTRAAGVRYGAV